MTPETIRVLLLTKEVESPPRSGGSIRVAAVAQALTSSGRFETVVIGVAGPLERRERPPLTSYLGAALILIRFLRTGSLTCLRWYRVRVATALLAAANHTDVIVVEHSQLLPYVLATGRPYYLDLHNVESALMRTYAHSASSPARRWSARYESWQLSRLERGGVLNAEATFVVSDHDANLLRGLVGRRQDQRPAAVLAPNGTSPANLDIALVERQPTAVFVANLGWRPNIDAARWLATTVWPRVLRELPDARLQLIGRSPSDEVLKLSGRGIEVHADVASVVPYIATSAVATAPLLAGGGTRLKIIEALSLGTPVVATRLGALGLEYLASDTLTICDEPAGFAAALVRHLRHPRARVQARAGIVDLTWDVTLAEMVNTLGRARQAAQSAHVRRPRGSGGARW